MLFVSLLILPAALGENLIQPAFVIAGREAFVWYRPRPAHAVELTALRPITKALEPELLADAPLVLDGYIGHARPLAGETFALPPSGIQHPAAPLIIHSKRWHLPRPRRTRLHLSGACPALCGRQLLQSPRPIKVRIFPLGVFLRPGGATDLIADAATKLLLLLLRNGHDKITFFPVCRPRQEQIIPRRPMVTVVETIPPHIGPRLHRTHRAREFDFYLLLVLHTFTSFRG